MSDITILIDGDDVKAFIQAKTSPLSIQWRAYESGTATVRLHDPAGTYAPEVGQTFEVWRDALTHIWGGQIETIKIGRYETASSATYIDITAVGYANILARRFIYPVFYQHKTPREIIADVLTELGEAITLDSDGTNPDGCSHFACTVGTDTFTYTSPGIIVLSDGQAVQVAEDPGNTYYVRDATSATFKLATDVGGTAVDFSAIAGAVDVFTIIDAVAYSYARATDVFNQLAGMANYSWWVDYEAKFHFAPATAHAAPFSLTNSSNNFRNMAVTTLRQDYRNRQFYRIPFELFSPDPSSFTGDGSTTAFDTTAMLARVVSVKVNGEDKTFGIRRQQTGLDWYYTVGDTYIYQDAAATPLTSSDTLEVTWYRLGTDVLVAEDPTEAAARAAIEGSSGNYEEITSDDGSFYPVAQLKCDALLTQFDQMTIAVSFETDEDGLEAGQYIPINVTAFGINSDFLINSVSSTTVDGQFFRSQVEAIGSTKRTNAVDLFKLALSGGSGGGGGVGSVGAFGGGVTTVGLSGIETMVPAAAHVVPTLGAKFVHQITLAANVTVDAPSPATPEHIFCLKFRQDGTGGRTVTFDAFYTGLSGFALDTTASTDASLIFQVNTAGTSAALIQVAMNGNPIA